MNVHFNEVESDGFRVTVTVLTANKISQEIELACKTHGVELEPMLFTPTPEALYMTVRFTEDHTEETVMTVLQTLKEML